MNDTTIKNYSTWARRELIGEVVKRCSSYGIYEEGSLPSTADSIDGRVLTSQEKTQRTDLLAILKSNGYKDLVERAAYTWFNRLLAIRFMEVNDRLPSHVRLLSAVDGSFKPQALAEAMDLDLEALDAAKVAELVQVGDDEALFRFLFLAQCDELASCMPAVFDRVGSAMELLLPDGLLKPGGVVEQLVTAIPERDWTEGVEIVGWMYQYYVSERKDEVFASFKKGKKAERDAIAPATQLFTPNWIVRYLTENSLGRLWMLNKPESNLPECMPYFVKPGDDAEVDFKHFSKPEEISVVDPACGSGHILVYAFDLLAAMYAEAGYSNRDAARFILEKNVSGMEIDPRAGAMASFALTMKACELDTRFLKREVSPRITVLERVEFTEEEKRHLQTLRSKTELLDAVAHLDECGSLLAVTSDDMECIERDLAALAGNASIFGGSATEKLERLQRELQPLSERYDVVVANPPYMGSSSLGKFMSKWVKKKYPEGYRDLCTSFIDRGFTLSGAEGYSAMVTMQSWMFLGSFEKLRSKILGYHSISSMAHLGTRAFGAIAGEVVSTTATVFANAKNDVPGTYLRLVDMGSESEKMEGALEALANPDCEWRHSANSTSFAAIPGCPIGYWASPSMISSFMTKKPLGERLLTREGMATADNDRFIREWYECCICAIEFQQSCNQPTSMKWYPYEKGGEYRKWYGNRELVVDWENNGEGILNNRDEATGRIRSHNYNGEYGFRQGITWSSISSAVIHVRWSPKGELFDSKGAKGFADSDLEAKYSMALINSSYASSVLRILAPTIDFKVGDIIEIPDADREVEKIAAIVDENIEKAKEDWDAFETSWDFNRHPLS